LCANGCWSAKKKVSKSPVIEAIKTYAHPNPNHQHLTFELKRMEVVYEQHRGHPDEPHMHDYYTILLVKKARGLHRIDFQEYPLEDRAVFFISPGQVHQVVEEAPSEGFIILFSRQFLAENNIRECFLEDINLFTDYGQSPPLQPDEKTFNRLVFLAEEMDGLLKTEPAFLYEAIGANLKLFLIAAHNACDRINDPNTQIVEAGLSILRAFKTSVEKHFKQEHQVGFYAAQLAVTPDHLNKTVKSLIGKTAKEYIQSRITTEARRLLLHSSLSAKEIAYHLGFQDPAHFSRFFKNCTGVSVRSFKAAATQ
jgi:AraC-like DNA-binding protein